MMTEMTEEMRARLPKAALRYIERLEMQLANAKERINSEYSLDDSNVIVDIYRDPPLALGMNRTVSFILPKLRDLRDSSPEITIEHSDERFLVVGSNKSRLLIKPSSSNQIYITTDNDW